MAENEDMKLKDAKQMHDGMNWDAIAALVPGRTKRQFSIRRILKMVDTQNAKKRAQQLPWIKSLQQWNATYYIRCSRERESDESTLALNLVILLT
jgi:hypothetical protein